MTKKYDPKEWQTVTLAADCAGYTRQRIYQMIEDDDVRHMKVHGLLLVPKPFPINKLAKK